MPLSITFIRHGESESNVVKDLKEANQEIPNEEALMRVHTSERRLTTKGVAQAQAAGVWMREWLKTRPGNQKRFYVSPYVRTQETAAHLGLGVDWRVDPRLVERNWGMMDSLTYEERIKRFGDTLNERKERAFFWRPSDGETLQDVFLRVRDFAGTLTRDCPFMDVVVVCHGEVMWVERTLLEYWTPHDLSAHMTGHDPKTYVSNCRIIQYTREQDNAEPAQRIVRVRFIDPTDPNNPEKNLDWQPIKRPLLSDADLLRFAEKHPRYLDV